VLLPPSGRQGGHAGCTSNISPDALRFDVAQQTWPHRVSSSHQYGRSCCTSNETSTVTRSDSTDQRNPSKERCSRGAHGAHMIDMLLYDAPQGMCGSHPPLASPTRPSQRWSFTILKLELAEHHRQANTVWQVPGVNSCRHVVTAMGSRNQIEPGAPLSV